MGRKDASNFGTSVSDARPDASPHPEPAGRYSVVMAERIVQALLRAETTRLAAPEGEEDLRRFFGHFFDPMISERERNAYITNFQRTPPITKLGYPRTGSEFPCIAIVLERDATDQEALGRYLGQTDPDDPADRAAEYVGSMFEQTYGIYIYAEHPDVCLYVYHFAKAVLLGSYLTMQEYGIIDPVFDGGDMSPQENYLPENMFVRRLGMTCKSLHTVPVLLIPDPRHLRVTGIWAQDIVVSGIRGGVSPIDPNED